MEDFIPYALIGFACAMLQPKQPRSVFATIALCVSLSILT